jgi:hypothetical protein
MIELFLCIPKHLSFAYGAFSPVSHANVYIIRSQLRMQKTQRLRHQALHLEDIPVSVFNLAISISSPRIHYAFIFILQRQI